MSKIGLYDNRWKQGTGTSTEGSSMTRRIIAIIAVAAMGSLLSEAAPIVVNASFEDEPYPISGGWDEGTGPVTGWIHSSSAHGSGLYGTDPMVAPNLSPVIRAPSIPDGTHAAYMWSAWGAECWFRQVISGFEPGKGYVLSYRANVRTDDHQSASTDLWVTLDTDVLVPVHQLSYNASEWYSMSSAPFTATASTYTLTFHTQTPGVGGDNGAMTLDMVSFAQIPEPTTLGLLGLMLVHLRMHRRYHGK